MASQSRHRRRNQRTTAFETLEQRVQNALNESRWTHARDLAKELVKSADTPANRQMLVRAALGRAKQLQAGGNFQDAASVLQGIEAYLAHPAEIKSVAESLARAGDLAGATRLAEKANDPQLPRRLLTLIADTDLRDRGRGKVVLPAELHAHRDLIRQAFAELEAGRDDKVAEVLQGIGLSSPYLEWKVLLRGLVAYYQGDDVRALENWQRLSPGRLPLRLAAPFRTAIDAEYRKAQSVEAQHKLAAQLEALQGGNFASRLRQLQTSMAAGKSLANVFREAEGVVTTLRADAPAAVPRLASCFFWAIIEHGQPEDVQRYRRVFGASPEDPQLHRLQALALERHGEMARANEMWQQYQKALAANPTNLPADHVARMRALVWERMGKNAEVESDDLGFGMPLTDFFRARPQPTPGPSAEQCFAESLKLAPDRLGPHAALFDYYLEQGKKAKALQAAKQLLKRFPEHVPTLVIAGQMLLEKGKNKDALAMFTRAVQASPLDVQLRGRLGSVHVAAAGDAIAAGELDAARASLHTALTLAEGGDKAAVLVALATCEFKAGANEKGEDFLQQAATKGSRLGVAFLMLVNSIRYKLPKAFKQRFEAEMNQLLAESPRAEDAVALAVSVSSLERAGVNYPGQKGHQKKTTAYIGKVVDADLDERQLLALCEVLQQLDSVRLFQQLLQKAQAKFPNNPIFYLAEARHELDRKSRRVNTFRVNQLLVKVRELAAALPVPVREPLLAQVKECEERMLEINPWATLYNRMGPENLFGFGGLDGDEDEDFDDDDDEDHF